MKSTQIEQSILTTLYNYECNNLLSESDLQKAIVEIIRNRGLFCSFINNNQYNSKLGKKAKLHGVLAGVPDLIMGINKRFVLVEIKTLKGRLSKEQRELHGYFEDNGYEVYIIKGVESLRDFLSRIVTS